MDLTLHTLLLHVSLARRWMCTPIMQHSSTLWARGKLCLDLSNGFFFRKNLILRIMCILQNYTLSITNLASNILKLREYTYRWKGRFCVFWLQRKIVCLSTSKWNFQTHRWGTTFPHKLLKYSCLQRSKFMMKNQPLQTTQLFREGIDCWRLIAHHQT